MSGVPVGRPQWHAQVPELVGKGSRPFGADSGTPSRRQRTWGRGQPTHLVRQPCDKQVLAHGRVLVHEAGALLAALRLPEQACLVDHPAEGDGAWDAPCGERHIQYPDSPRGRPETQTRRALRNMASATGVHSGCKGGLMVLSLGACLHAGRFPTVFDSGGARVLVRKWVPLGENMAMGPSSGRLGNGALPLGGHSLVRGRTPARRVPLCGECTPQLCPAPSHSTIPRVLTTIHWIPSAKDRCWSQTHLQRKTGASTPGRRGQVTPHSSGRVLAEPRAASPGGKHLTEAVSSLLPQLSGGPGTYPAGVCRAPP